jgi:hypothetical protein
MPRLVTHADRERAVVEEAQRHYAAQQPKARVGVRARPMSSAEREQQRIRREWENRAAARRERRIAQAAERRTLWEHAAHGCATREELDRLFPSRYGKL